MTVNVRELNQAERLILEIERNYKHPAMDPRHRNHRQAADALSQLKLKVAQTRARLEAQSHFKF